MSRTKISNDQAVILEDETYSNSIIPSLRKEMWRRIELHGDTRVLGGIFGETLLVGPGNVFVRDAAYLRDHIRIQVKPGSHSWFNSVVSARNTIDKARCPARTRFSTDVHAKAINLNNAIVYGNIVCSEAILEDCVVLGGVYAQDQFEVGNSVLGTFEAGSLVQRSTIGLLQPFAMCRQIGSRTGRIFNLMPFSEAGNGKATIYEFSEQDITTKQIENPAGKAELWFLFSVANRVFDLSAYQRLIMENLRLIENSVGKDDPAGEEEQNRLLKTFDDHFFEFIGKKFAMEYDLPFSDFMNHAVATMPGAPAIANVSESTDPLREKPSSPETYKVVDARSGDILGWAAAREVGRVSLVAIPHASDPRRFLVPPETIEMLEYGGASSPLTVMLREWMKTAVGEHPQLDVRFELP
jgi:hypothetical protein